MPLKPFTWESREIKEQKNTKALALLCLLAWLTPLMKAAGRDPSLCSKNWWFFRWL